jgi:ABC-type transport system involved in multi-copper enzyme maturation permease subunit
LDALRYEFIRFRSLRSTWVLLLTGPVFQFLIALIWAGHHDMATNARFSQSFLGLFLVLVALPSMAIAVNAFGNEYRFRTITTTTLTLRTPGRILGAKAIVAGLCGAVSGALLVGATLLAEVLMSSTPTDAGLVGQVLLGAILFTSLSCLVGLGVAEVSRNGTVALVVMVVFPAIIETALGFTRISPSILPFRAAEAFLTATAADRWTLLVPLLAVAAVLLGASWVSLRRRDA